MEVVRHTTRRFVLAAISGLGALLASSRSLAADPPAATAFLTWADPARAPSCITLDSLRDAVSQVLGRAVETDPARAESLADVSFDQASDGGWNVRIRRMDRSGAVQGERTLHGADADCGSLLGPASLVLAMVLDRPSHPAVLHVPPPPAPSPRRWSGRAAAGVRAAYGMLPELGGAVVASADVIPKGWVPLRWTLSVWPGAETHSGQVGGRFRLWTGGLSACPPIRSWSWARVEACAGVGVGSLSAAGMGLSPSREPGHFWGHAEVSVEATIRLAAPVGLRVGAGGLVPWNRPRFVYESQGGSAREAHKPWAVSPVVGAVLEVELGP